MALKLKSRIVGMAVLAALLPLIAALTTILIERSRVQKDVYDELVQVGQENLSRTALNVYGMCKAFDSSIASKGGIENVDPSELQALREEIMNIKIGNEGYVYVLGGKGDDRGHYIISLEGKSDGADIWDSSDDNGKKFIQEVVQGAVNLDGGQTFIEEYSWKNKGELLARKKIVAVTYYKPWDWVIGAGSYEEEFLKAERHVASAITNMVVLTAVIGLLILIFAVVAAYVTAMQITKPINFIALGAKQLSLGDIKLESLDHTMIAKINNRKDELGDVGRSFTSLIENLSNKTEAADEISKGNLNVEINVASEVDVLGHAMVEMKNQITSLIDEVRSVADNARHGDLNARGDLDRFDGAWEDLVAAVNDTIGTVVSHLDSVPAPVMLIDSDYNILYMNKAGASLDGKTGKELVGSKCFNFFKTADCNTEKCACHKAMNTKQLASSETDAHPGDLNLDIAYTGTPLKDKDGNIVGALEIVSDQTAIKTAQRKDAKVAEFQNKEVEKLFTTLNSMAEGDLAVNYETAAGDQDTELVQQSFSSIAGALNSTIDSLNEILGQVQVAVEQVNSGAGQVSSASQSLSQGATEQASSLEEVSASMTEVGSQTKQNADNAIQANQLASSARGAAEQGNSHMKGMLDAMKDINNKSAEIQKIVKAIDDIAFQTNLLALNAAVEAARAGVHGKGFAVVAEEVRNLAQRSATAAKETTDLIDSNVSAVTGGTKIADQTAQALGEITDGVTKVTDLINEIASASREQTMAVDQIAEALGQIDQVTQSNTASAEESAAAAEELSGQSTQLQEMISRFKLKKQQSRSTTPLVGGGMNRRSIEASDTHVSDSKSRDHHDKNRSGTQVNPRDVIELDDVDFKEF